MSSDIVTPLSIDLPHATRMLLADFGLTLEADARAAGVDAAVLEAAFSAGGPAEDSPSKLLEAISSLAGKRGLSHLVLDRFHDIATDILARWLDQPCSTTEDWEQRLVVAAGLADTRPELWSFIFTFITHSPFKQSPLALVDLGNISSTPSDRLHQLLVAYLRLVVADSQIANRLAWSPTPLRRLMTDHADAGVRLVALLSLARQLRWGEAKREKMELQWVGDVQATEALIAWDFKVATFEDRPGFEIQAVMVDGWILPLLESRRASDYDEYRYQRHQATPVSPNPTHFHLFPQHLSPRTAVICERISLRYPSATPSVHVDTFLHVDTPGATAAAREILHRLDRSLPILISAPPSSGKSHIVQYISHCLRLSAQPTDGILTIPLADTTIDAKALIGSYVSSPTQPGTFQWMEGALTKAVRTGKWVVFEDIDRASPEVLCVIADLAATLSPNKDVGGRARLAVASRDSIEAGYGFALFATRTIADANQPMLFKGHHNFSEVHLAAPSDDDVLAILSARFPRLAGPAATALVQIWQDLKAAPRGGGQVKPRDVGLRDLEKWCARVERLLPTGQSSTISSGKPFANPVLQEEIFLEAIDVFVAAYDNRQTAASRRRQSAAIIATHLDMEQDRALSLLEKRSPLLEISGPSQGPGATEVRLGRACLTGSSRRPGQIEDSRPYALTRPSMILLEQIATATLLAEPTLLVGETGTGKTTAVQHLASLIRRPLTVLNLSMQTESGDLLGGFKPMDPTVSARNLQSRWQTLFLSSFSMSRPQNKTYLEASAKSMSAGKWARCTELWTTSARRALEKITKQNAKFDTEPTPRLERESSPKKRRVDKGKGKGVDLSAQWQALLEDAMDFDLLHVKSQSKLVFSFIEGPLVKALREGEWLLLDEVNLASQETLESIATVLEGATASVVLTERGDLEPVPRHPEFRLFACMNPATDVGKKDLPPALRSRFTEIYVPPPDDDRDALITIVSQYLGDASAGDRAVILDIVELYSSLKALSHAKEIVDGSNAAPHYSMRTLARALSFAVQVSPIFGLRRGLWEGCLMAFTMSLDAESATKARQLCEIHLLRPMKNARAALAQVPSLPAGSDPDDFIRFGHFWLNRGSHPVMEESNYIMTPSVEAKLSDLARVILTKRFPVLIQGPTSSGKTSAVEFLARRTGHRFVRINNHEHTDIQEYLGTYISDPITGQLIFQEGLLVKAVREGHWIVLDELNLAPTDVLEALNRLLDDNRELVIPETQEVIRPHPNFMLFATQNPPGLYAGRKVLSRAFRNRFLEVHFDDVPRDELQTILCQRCQIAPSYAESIVKVFEELRHRRQSTRVFESKQSFATLRDLFRWAERRAVGYQQLANDGYMLLAERARNEDDKLVIKEVLEAVMKVQVRPNMLYHLDDASPDGILSRLALPSAPSNDSHGIIWTSAMQRLFILVAAAARHNEPVLLVGETGCGKTSVCEVIAQAFNQRLVSVNCHQNMETADLLGSQRPMRNRSERKAGLLTRLSEACASLLAPPLPSPDCSAEDIKNFCQQVAADNAGASSEVLESIAAIPMEAQRLSALFEWSDGPLVHAMHRGDLLLLDEVSLADDSVLERLNSVLEPARTLVLAEKGGVDIEDVTVIASAAFQVVATMNPGGDFGKKELSPALRNRFTEIWVPPLNDRDDLLQIIGKSWRHDDLKASGPLILDFFEWFSHESGGSDKSGIGLRDILSWVTFSNGIRAHVDLNPASIFLHSGCMVIVDGLESLPQVAGLSSTSIETLRQACMSRLRSYASHLEGSIDLSSNIPSVALESAAFRVGSFAIPLGPSSVPAESAFSMQAPTTCTNALRVVRACQIPKAILLEGSPGVGKTSLVSALAAITGHNLCRINLSDQTDLIDLFGSDLPVEGGKPGEFQWRDAAFLTALQNGDWVLLDEMNLASQTVLEGLNAVLDHRGTVYIPELGRAFERHPDFRVFAAQNPLQQGGGRKGLPKSFLNRFTKVYLQEHTPNDLVIICQHLYPALATDTIERMVAFNERMRIETMVTRSIGREGSPWEFNLRDLTRWLQLLGSPSGLEQTSHPVEHLAVIYINRFRNASDRQRVSQIFTEIFDIPVADTARPWPSTSPNFSQVGSALLARSGNPDRAQIHANFHADRLPLLEAVSKCITMGWLVILAGPSAAGKRTLIRQLAATAGRPLGEFSMHPGVDTTEVLGSFEQADALRGVRFTLRKLVNMLDAAHDRYMGSGGDTHELTILRDGITQWLSSFSLEVSHALQLAQSSLAWLNVHAEDDENLQAVAQEVACVLQSDQSAASFDWIDGQLLSAIKNGTWFAISDANLCSPSVLDRLNSLCENNGRLILSERGSVGGQPEIIVPHPNFRLFMLYDPRTGELSRAMRNRGIELSMDQREPNIQASWYGQSGDDQSQEAVVISLKQSQGATAIRAAHLEDHSTLRFAAQASPSSAPIGSSVDHTAAVVAFVLSSQGQKGLAKAARVVASLSPLHSQASAHLLSRLVDHAQKLYASNQSVVRAVQGVPEAFLSDLPLDCSINPHVQIESAGGALTSAIRLLVLNDIHRLAVEEATTTTNRSSVLAKSRVLVHKPVQREESSRNVQAVYPVTSEARNLAIERMLQSSNIVSEVEHWEHLLALVTELEHACSTSLFDYSAVQVIVDELLLVLPQLPLSEALTSQVRVLSSAVEITSGLGQVELWTALRPRIMDPALQSVLHTLCDQVDSIADHSLRASILQAVSLASEETASSELSQLQDLTSGVPRVEVDEAAWQDLETTGVLELGYLSNQNSIDANVLTRRLLNERSIPAAELVGLCRLYSLNDSLTLLPAFFDWQNRLWATREPLKSMNGPGSLMRPVFLQNVLRITDCGSLRLHDIARQEVALSFAAQAVQWQAVQKSSRVNDLGRVLIRSFLEITRAFRLTFEEEDWNRLQSSSDLSPVHLRNILSIVPRSTSTALTTSFEARFGPALQRLESTIGSSQTLLLKHVGGAFIDLGLFLAELYVTNVPIDPASRQHMMIRIIESKTEALSAELIATEAALLQLVGELHHPRVAALRSKIDTLREEIRSLGPAIRRESIGPAALSAFFQEVHAFVTDVFQPARMKELGDSLATAATSDTNVFLREEAFQLSSQGFSRRLRNSYTPFADLAQPVLYAIGQAQLGMRCITRARELENAQESSEATRDAALAVSFPTVAGAVKISRSSLHGANAPALVLALAAQAYDSHGAPLKEAVPHIANRYEHLFELWSADRLREQRASMEAESLYRVRQTQEDVMSDPEIEEKEFSELFPSYEVDEEEDTEPTTASNDLNKQHGSAAVTAPLAKQVYDLHLSLFGDHKQLQVNGSHFRTLRDSLLSKALRSEPAAADNGLDLHSLAYQVSCINETNAKLLSSNSSPSYDFYRSENLPEVRKGYNLVTRLVVRLDQIIQEWPDQMVLQHLRERCEAILRFHLASPVAQVLTSLERLLVHTDDWEAYANRDNTLRVFQKDISDLIVDWRRLELACWAHLLDSQAVLYANETTDWWFRLYGVVIHGAWGVASVLDDGAAISGHLQGMIPLLRTFIEQCTLGHFEARMRLLRSFVNFLQALAGCSQERSAGLLRIADTLESLIAFFDTYSSKILTSLSSQRVQVDKAIRDFIKLASWKDINVNALKASALKSHRQLHKSIRKFRDILRQPVAPMLAAYIETTDATPIASVIEPLNVIADLHDVDIPNRATHLAKLASTYKRYVALHAKGRVMSVSAIASDLDCFCADIIDVTDSLSKETPSTATKDNEKLVKNLATRKRKALSDLMKALRTMGLTFNVRADQLARQQSPLWLAELRPVKCAAWPSLQESPLVTKIEAYHQRMIALMPILRKSLVDHNIDVTTRDLQRGIGFVESSFEKALLGRVRLATTASDISEIATICSRLQTCASEGVVTGGREAVQNFQNLHSNLVRVLDASQEASASCVGLGRLTGEASMVSHCVGVVDAIVYDIQDLLQRLPGILQGPDDSVFLITQEDTRWIQAAQSALDKARSTLSRADDLHPATSYLVVPLLSFINDVPVPNYVNFSAAPHLLDRQADDLIDSLLVAAQKLPTAEVESEAETNAVHLQTEEKRLRRTADALLLPTVLRRLRDFAGHVTEHVQTHGGTPEVPDLLRRVLPFIETYLNSSVAMASAEIDNTKVLYKLTYILAKTMLNLAEKGFCKPGEEDKSKQKDGEGETSEGTGMGAGTGDKNVSDEIEDESQVEGLQGEKEEEDDDKPENNDEDGEDNAFDMEDDFEGEMADRDGEDEEEGSENEDGDDDHDEHVGDVDPLDPGAVDEKFWDEEKDESKEQSDEQLDQKTEQTGESEMTAKDDKSQTEKDKKQGESEDSPTEPQEAPAGQEQDDVEKPEGASEDGQPESENEDDGPEQQRNPDEVAMPEANNLDMPDLPDLDLDGDDEQGDQAEEEGMDIDLGDDDNGDEEPPQSPGEDQGQASEDDGEHADDGPDATAPTEEEAIDTDPVAAADLDMSESKDGQNQEASADSGQKGDGVTGEEKQKAEEKKGEEDDVKEDKEETADTDAEEANKGAAAPDAGQTADDLDDDGGAEGEGGAPQAAAADGRPQSSRSLGDIMKEIRRRRDEILNQADDREEPTDQPTAPNQAPGQVEYLKEDDEQDEDMQALGPAGEEEQQKLADLNIVDDDAEDTRSNPDVAMENADDDAHKPGETQQADFTHQDISAGGEAKPEQALTQAQVEATKRQAAEGDESMDVDEEQELEATMEQPLDVQTAEVEATMRDWVATGRPDDSGEAMWRLYSSLTSDLSFALCEQLRLILEPTLATRLQGDFRTGKRLNMRKIIPYIASEFTKDKIWLRRTKPSKREYQVLLSLDDSRSMAESHSVHLAYQTLALVSQALNKLEVGQVSIARFGEGVEILHPFGDSGFSDTDGAKVMSAFKFDQHRTDVAALVERSLDTLAAARQASTSSSPDLWQLEIIISDGVCQDHARLRALLRRALEERVMIVFLIVDSLGQSSAPSSTLEATSTARTSILSMQSVAYKQVNGQMQLEMERYLDTFPFDYYVVLRDVEALPNVLAETLRQWMSRVAESNE